jgi:hypothetical protein
VISSRFATAVCVLVLVALVPTIIHSYAALVVDDGRRATRVPEVLDSFTSQPTGRNPNWGRRHFETDDWIEREYSSSTGEATLCVVRSYDLKTLYHHPEIEIVEGASLVKNRVETFQARPEVPVFVLETASDRGPVVLYALLYRDGFVQDPLWFQLRTAGELLFRGRQAMTLFFVREQNVPAGADLSSRASAAVLFAAIEQFLAPDIEGSRPGL